MSLSRGVTMHVVLKAKGINFIIYQNANLSRVTCRDNSRILLIFKKIPHDQVVVLLSSIIHSTNSYFDSSQRCFG